MLGVSRLDNVWTAMLAIEQHFKSYPQAKDTVDGARFWCDAYGVAASRSVVEEALNGLMELGVVKQQAYGRSGRVAYSRIPGVEIAAPDLREFLRSKLSA